MVDPFGNSEKLVNMARLKTHLKLVDAKFGRNRVDTMEWDVNIPRGIASTRDKANRLDSQYTGRYQCKKIQKKSPAIQSTAEGRDIENNI
jgi:hypothetical protein